MSEVWLITGAAGFIGSNVAHHLLSQGHTVIGLDDLSSGDIHNVESFQTFPNWHWRQGDINSLILPEVFHQHEITHVLHLAALVSVKGCDEFPAQARHINEQGFEAVFNIALAHHVKQFIYASSSAVYGNAAHLPIVETMPLIPLSVYGETKRNNEIYADKHTPETGMSCIGMRFFNLFGPHQRADNPYAAVIPKWIDAISANSLPIIYGDGSATRDFCSVQNVILAIDCARRELLLGHHVFNIGTGKPTSLKELYSTLCELMEKYPEPQHLEWIPDHIVHSCADISLAQSLLKYHPEVTLEDGLKLLLGS